MRGIHLALVAPLLVTSTTLSAQLADGSFETQAATVGNYCYFGSVAEGNPPCPAGAWSGSSGLQDEANIAWPGIATPDGSKYGFVQQDGTLTQTFIADASGSFFLTWLSGGRPDILSPDFGGDQSYMVTLNALDLGTYFTTSGQAFTSESTGAFELFAGNSYTLTFTGLSTSDETAFIDLVQLQSAVPEPTTWAMLMLGFSVTGLLFRRRSLKGSPLALAT